MTSTTPALTTAVDAAPRPAPPPAPSALRRFARRFDRIFLMAVALPTLLACLYYGLIASDVYVSESRFVVRSPERGAPTGINALLAGVGISRSRDDTYTVHSFIQSRDAMRELDGRAKLREAFSSTDIDRFNRFPGWIRHDASFEALYEHYLDHVDISYDTVSSITVLQVRGFTAAKAQEINEQLLEMSERLVNNLNDRSRHDLIEVAQREVDSAEKRSRETAAALAVFRNKNGVFDPGRESAGEIDNVARLREELRVNEIQLARLRQLTPANPQVATLKAQVLQLRRTIDEETAKVVGSKASMASKSTAYDRLMLDKSFADQQYAATLASLEAARNDSARKQLYLERLVQPNVPDMALEPRRLRAVATVLVVGLIAWGVISLLVAGVREHLD